MYRMHPMRWVWIGLGALLLVFGGLWLIGRSRYYPGYGYGMPMMGWGLPFGIFGGLVAIMFIVMIVRFAFWGGYRGYRHGYWRGYGGESRAEEILRERYARGELTKEQYDQMLRDIQRDRQS